ncbi:MAG: hypothetical protein GY722_18355, partial [bacterium]|nr:hypothetical protein [bacterium]
APDLVVHVGDYNYRGTPSHIGDSGDAYDGCTGDTINVTEEDGWKTWNKDFFTPAADLLMSTPWVISRGNHELCSRAGTGFFYLLAPFSPLLGTEPYHCGSHQHQEAVTSSLACPNGGGGSPSVYYVTTEPYLLDLGNLQLAMVDTANACDLPCESFNLETLSANFSTVHGLTKGPTWLVSHRPLWGVKEEDTDEADSSREPEWINQTLEVALADSTLKGYENINLLLAGHIHLFESVTFDDSTPPQLIVGNGGVELESHPPPSGTTPPPPPPAGNFFSKEEHGFLILEVASAGEWSGTLYDPSGNEMAKC